MDFTSNKRPDDMQRITTPELANAFIDEAVEAMRAQVGDGKVLLALSGGVDSSVVAALLIKAIGKQLVCVHVNHGLMRKGESEQVIDVFQKCSTRRPPSSRESDSWAKAPFTPTSSNLKLASKPTTTSAACPKSSTGSLSNL